MKILLLGGTGAIGTHLQTILEQKDCHNIYITTRRNNVISSGNIHYIFGNAHSFSFLEDILKEKWDVIVDFMVYHTPEFETRHKWLLNATSQYIFLSSARVYAENDGLIREDSPRILDVCKNEKYLKTDEYALAKARQENILIQKHTNNWTIIRPYITYSEKRFQLGSFEKEIWLYRALRNKKIVFSKDIAEKETTLTYGFDVARGIASLIGEKNALGEAFHITHPSHRKWNDVLLTYMNTIKECTGINVETVFLDKSPQLLYAKHQVMYDRVYNRCFDTSKISKFVDVGSFTPDTLGLAQCLSSFLKHPAFSPISFPIEAYLDRITVEKMSVQEIGDIKNKIKYLFFRYVPGAFSTLYRKKIALYSTNKK